VHCGWRTRSASRWVTTPPRQSGDAYKTRRGSLRVAGPLGLLGALRRIARRHEWQRISPELAQPGDVGMAWTVYQGRPVLATVMCRDRGWFVGRADFGFAAVRANKVAVAWSVLDDALATGPGPRVNLRHWKTNAPVPAEPVSTGIAILSLFEITGVSTFVAGAVAVLLLPGCQSAFPPQPRFIRGALRDRFEYRFAK